MNRTDLTLTFIGRYYHALEQKGRLSIPAAFRPLLGKQAILTLGLDGCLFLYSLDTWENNLTAIDNLPFTKKNTRDWIRLQTNNANLVEFDSLGRIQIPEYLREQAGFSKDLVIVGSHTHLEIWDRDRYHAYLEDINQRAEAIAEALPITQHE